MAPLERDEGGHHQRRTGKRSDDQSARPTLGVGAQETEDE
jgi:hypothetical protein